MKSFIWLFPLCLAVGCDASPTFDMYELDAEFSEAESVHANASQLVDVASEPINVNNWHEIVRDSDESLQHRIDAAFFGIDQDTCFLNGLNGGDVSGCDFDIFTAGLEHVDPGFDVGSSEAVLIMDVLTPSVEMLRYRNRIRGFYSVQTDGTIGAVPMEWELPKTFGDIVISFATSPAIPSENLATLQPRLSQVYGGSVPGLSTHGLAVFNILADLIPNNPIVFLDNNLMTFHRAIPETFCAVQGKNDHANLDRLRAHSQLVALYLGFLFQLHDIRFVNASWGYTIETIRGPWPSVCGTPVPSEGVLLAILDAYRPIFDVLFNTPGVFTAHAALSSPTNDHYPFDQASADFPNRLRVGSFEHDGNQVPAQGLTDVPPSFSPVPTGDDADVWVNSGCVFFFFCRPDRPLSLTLQYGMGRGNFPITQSSFLNPILLGTFVHARNQRAGEAMNNTLIDSLINTIIPECAFGLVTQCRYIDPLLHEQFDRFNP